MEIGRKRRIPAAIHPDFIGGVGQVEPVDSLCPDGQETAENGCGEGFAQQRPKQAVMRSRSGCGTAAGVSV